MPFDDVYLVTPNRDTASPEHVGEAERLLKTKFPDGYGDFVSQFGEGTYSGFVRVYMASRIISENPEFQQRWSEYFFWDKGHDVLRRERVVESVIIADTLQGDELIFHPSDPGRLFVLPHGDERIFQVGTELEAALGWMCDSGELTAPIGFKWFESWKNRQRLSFSGPADFDNVRKALLNLGVHDHARHDTDEEDGPFFEMFVPDIHGSVTLLSDEATVQALVWRDADAGAATLQTIGDQLDRLGLVQPDSHSAP